MASHFTGQTRYFNETIDMSKIGNSGSCGDVIFTCNGIEYNHIYIMGGGLTYRYYDESGKLTREVFPYNPNTGWKDEIYRTITIIDDSASKGEYFGLIYKNSVEVSDEPPVYYTLRINGVETNVYKGQVINSITINGNEYLIKK
jgi:hypothetical protein